MKSEVQGKGNTDSALAPIEVIPSRNNEDLGKNRRASTTLHSSIQTFKEIARQIVSSDEESRRLIAAALQERIEADYLRGLIETDRNRFFALREQVRGVNGTLTEIFGERFNLVKLYVQRAQEDTQAYPALNTPEGMQRFFGSFYPDLASQVLAAAETASERGEIEAQKALVVLRRELTILQIEQQGTVAETLIKHAESIKKGEEVKGEIMAARVEGLIKTTIGVLPFLAFTVAEAPVEFFKGMGKGVGRWIKEEPAVAVPATVFGLGTAGLEIYYFITASNLPAWTSSFGVTAFVFVGSSAVAAMGGIAVSHIITGLGRKIGEGWGNFVEDVRNSEVWRGINTRLSGGNTENTDGLGEEEEFQEESENEGFVSEEERD